MNNISSQTNKTGSIHQCNKCNRSYSSSKNLWRHKQTCNNNSSEDCANDVDKTNDEIVNHTGDNSTISAILQNTSELTNIVKIQQQLMSQQQQQMVNIIDKMCSNTTTHNNSHNTNTNNSTLNQNKTFNMNFFLNEHCKNAIDIGDFIKKLNYSKENMLENRTMNYHERISNQFKNGFDDCKVEERPIHCSDLKRNKIYIRDNGEWISGKDSEKKIKQIVVGMGRTNMDTFRNWVNDNPACLRLDTPSYDLYMCIFRNMLGPTSDEQEDKFVNKIINTIVEETVIDKEKYAVC